MKYTKGTPTLLGKIEEVDTSCTSMPYLVNRDDTVGHWFTESEIDAIVINPKRNIDHLIELIEAKKREEAVEFYKTFERKCYKGAQWSILSLLVEPYIEPRKYPVLTPEELKAVKWLVEGGFKTIRNYNTWVETAHSDDIWLGVNVPPLAKRLQNSTWLTETPINLKELLEAQEGV